MAVRAQELVRADERSQTDWDMLAAKAKRNRLVGQSLLIGFLIVVSLPILLPYFWMFTISVSAKTGGVESAVLWKACAVLVPTVIAFGLMRMAIEGRRHRIYGGVAIIAVALFSVIWSIGDELHLANWGFLWDPDMVAKLEGRRQATVQSQFPSVWTAFFNSLASLEHTGISAFLKRITVCLMRF